MKFVVYSDGLGICWLVARDYGMGRVLVLYLEEIGFYFVELIWSDMVNM